MVQSTGEAEIADERPLTERGTETDLRRLLDTATDAIAVHRAGKVVYANPAILKLLGYDRLDQILGRSPVDFVSPRYRDLVARRVFKESAGGRAEPELEERFLHASGREVPVQVLATPLRFEGRLATLVHVRDLTAIKALEGRLHAADRLASAGFVAAAVVHEVDAPLALALKDVQLLGRRLDAVVPTAHAEELHALCERVNRGLLSVRSVVRDVEVLSGATREARGALDVHVVLDSIASLVGFQLRGCARLVKRYGDVPPVSGSRAKLGQVFANVLVNAAQAIPPGDEVGNEITIVTFTRAHEVVIEIHDTGTGIATELLDGVFEPFFTTKAHATGLGLSVSRSLLEAEGGSITVRRGSGGGTTFVVTLRAASARAHDTMAAHP